MSHWSLGGLVASEDARYEFKSVSTIRGGEARAIAKWEKEGWELDTQSQALLRTKMVFRRVKAKQRWGALVVALLVPGIILGVMAFQERGVGGTTESVASPTETEVVPSRQPTVSLSQESSAPPQEASEAKPLWTKTDGPQTIQCIASENIQEVRFALPATSPVTDELNSILKDFDGRSPLTVLTVTEIDHASYPQIDESDYMRTLYLETPSGELALDRRDNDAWRVLDDTSLAGIASDAGTKTLRDRARALSERIGEDDLHGTHYLVTKLPITQVSAGHAEFKSTGNPCSVL